MFTINGKTTNLNTLIAQLNHFGDWLLSSTPDQFSLSNVAKQVCHFFPIEYCAIHIQAEGKWHNSSGNWTTNPDIPELLRIPEDHSPGVLELAEEQLLGVRNIPLQSQDKTIGLLVLNSTALPEEMEQAMANLITLFLMVSFGSEVSRGVRVEHRL